MSSSNQGVPSSIGATLRSDDTRSAARREIAAAGAEGRRGHDRVADQVGTENDDLHAEDMLSGHSFDHRITSWEQPRT